MTNFLQAILICTFKPIVIREDHILYCQEFSDYWEIKLLDGTQFQVTLDSGHELRVALINK
jgi:hypothetical protein